MLSEFKKLDPILAKENLINRSVCRVDAQPLVLFHKNGASLEPQYNKCWSQLLSKFGWGEVSEVDQSADGWSANSNFNCHTFAIGAKLGLTSNDWLEGISSSLTFGLNPARLLLERYFQPTISVRRTEKNGFESSKLVNEQDVFVLKDTHSNRLVHSGIVKWVDDQPMAISKFGEGPILQTTFKLIWKFYGNKFDQLSWYQFGQAKKRVGLAAFDIYPNRKNLFAETTWKPRRWRSDDLRKLASHAVTKVCVVDASNVA